MCCPPLIAMLAPVRNAASSLDRYATRPATSSGLPRRPIGICGMILLSSTSFGIAITIFVPMYPGEMVFAVTPLRATSSASALVKPCMPALAAE